MKGAFRGLSDFWQADLWRGDCDQKPKKYFVEQGSKHRRLGGFFHFEEPNFKPTHITQGHMYVS